MKVKRAGWLSPPGSGPSSTPRWFGVPTTVLTVPVASAILRRAWLALSAMMTLRNPDGVRRAIRDLSLTADRRNEARLAVIDTLVSRFFEDLPPDASPGTLDAMRLLDQGHAGDAADHRQPHRPVRRLLLQRPGQHRHPDRKGVGQRQDVGGRQARQGKERADQAEAPCHAPQPEDARPPEDKPDAGGHTEEDAVAPGHRKVSLP